MNRLYTKIILAVFAAATLLGCNQNTGADSNRWEHEIRLKSSGSGQSSFRLPDEPVEIERLDFSKERMVVAKSCGFAGKPKDEQYILSKLTLLPDKSVVIGIEGIFAETGWDTVYKNFIHVQDMKISSTCYLESNPDENSMDSADFIVLPITPPIILGLEDRMYMEDSGEFKANTLYASVTAYDFQGNMMWQQKSRDHRYSLLIKLGRKLTIGDGIFYLTKQDSWFRDCGPNEEIQSYLSCWDYSGNELWSYPIPGYDIGYEIHGSHDAGVYSDRTVNSNGTVYISNEAMILAVAESGELLAYYGFDDHVDSHVACAANGKQYLLAIDRPTQEEVERANGEYDFEKASDVLERKTRRIRILNEYLSMENYIPLPKGNCSLIGVTVDGSCLVVRDGEIIQVDQHGSEMWTYPIEGWVFISDIASDSTGRVFVVNEDTVTVISPTGELMWEYSIDEEISDWCLAGDGLLYIVTGHELIALGESGVESDQAEQPGAAN